MKYLLKSILGILLIVFFGLNLNACKSCDKNRPWLYTNVVWLSNDPVIKITAEDSNSPKGYMIINNEKIDIVMLWGESYYFAIVYADFDIVSNETTLIKGNLDFDDKSVTLIIEKDNIFNNKYSEIVLSRRAIEEIS